MYDAENFVKKYFDILKINDKNNSTFNYISKLQKKHIETFFWDTIDIFLKRNIKLDPNETLEKFLNERKGGVCYELNGTFCYLLNQIGFDAYLASAYVYGYNDDVFNFEIDTHVVIILKFSENFYLVDVGWGDSYRSPVLLKDNTFFSDATGDYTLYLEQSTKKFGLKKFILGEWRKQYDFSIKKSELISFYKNLNIVYNDPAHQAHRNLTCIKPNKDGYVAIKNNELIIKSGNSMEKNSFEEFGGIQNILIKYFCITPSFVTNYF